MSVVVSVPLDYMTVSSLGEEEDTCVSGCQCPTLTQVSSSSSKDVDI